MVLCSNNTSMELGIEAGRSQDGGQPGLYSETKANQVHFSL